MYQYKDHTFLNALFAVFPAFIFYWKVYVQCDTSQHASHVAHWIV